MNPLVLIIVGVVAWYLYGRQTTSIPSALSSGTKVLAPSTTPSVDSSNHIIAKIIYGSTTQQTTTPVGVPPSIQVPVTGGSITATLTPTVDASTGTTTEEYDSVIGPDTELSSISPGYSEAQYGTETLGELQQAEATAQLAAENKYMHYPGGINPTTQFTQQEQQGS